LKISVTKLIMIKKYLNLLAKTTLSNKDHFYIFQLVVFFLHQLTHYFCYHYTPAYKVLGDIS